MGEMSGFEGRLVRLREGHGPWDARYIAFDLQSRIGYKLMSRKNGRGRTSWYTIYPGELCFTVKYTAVNHRIEAFALVGPGHLVLIEAEYFEEVDS